MTYKAKDTIEWFENFNDFNVLIRTANKEFYFDINQNNLPHLLGLQYVYGHYFPAKKIIKDILNNDRKDDELIDKIRNRSLRKTVISRVDSFQDFFEHIESSYLVERTKLDTKIKSDYFFVNEKEENIQQLGILKTDSIDLMIDFDVYIPETYFVQKYNKYFKEAQFKENIKEILFYDEDRWRAGSFDLKKDNVLKNTYLGLTDQDIKPIRAKLYRDKNIFEMHGLRFIPYREFNKDERKTPMDVLLEIDGLYDNDIGKIAETYDRCKTNADIFYCLETRNLYTPAEGGMMKLRTLNPEKFLNDRYGMYVEKQNVQKIEKLEDFEI